MSIRRALLLLSGLAVAAIVLMAAAQWLLLSFQADPLVGREAADGFTRWITRAPRPGAAILSGVALVGVSAWLFWSMLRSRSTDRRVVTTRRREGWTKVDAPTLEDAIERSLESVDRRNDVSAKIRSGGRVDLRIVTPDPSSMGPTQELRDTLHALCERRSLPCEPGRILSTTPRRSSGRRRVR